MRGEGGGERSKSVDVGRIEVRSPFGAEAEICGMANEGGVRNSVSGRSHRVAGVFLDSAPSKNSAATFYALFLSVSLGLE